MKWNKILKHAFGSWNFQCRSTSCFIVWLVSLAPKCEKDYVIASSVNMILMIKAQFVRKLSYILIKFPMKNITQISISPHCQVVIWIFKEPMGLNFLHISVSDNCQFWFFENFPESSWVWTLVFFFLITTQQWFNFLTIHHHSTKIALP